MARKGARLLAKLRKEGGQPFHPESLQDFVAGLFPGKLPRLTEELIRERRREALRALKKEADQSGS
jgi:hypothetical protein